MVVICEASEIQSLWGNIVAKELQNILNILLSLCQGACGNLKQWLVNLFHLEVLQNWCHTIFNHALHEWPPQRDWQACFTSCNCTCPSPLDGSLNLLYFTRFIYFHSVYFLIKKVTILTTIHDLGHQHEQQSWPLRGSWWWSSHGLFYDCTSLPSCLTSRLWCWSSCGSSSILVTSLHQWTAC